MKRFLGTCALALFLAVPAMATEPQLTAKVVDKSRPGDITASVMVDVQNVELVDPASVQEQPKEGQGHLHYQVDDGFMIATTAKKLSFHGLKPGEHTFKVMLAQNNHAPAGPQQTLTFKSA